jgi:Flp pilus assembly pilin Flp
MWRLLKCVAVDIEGASSSEYAILVALIAAVVIMAISGLGTTVNTVLYSNINSIMAAVGGS